MRTGQSGRAAIFWNQTEIDGLEAAPLSFLEIGAAWSWRGQARYLVETSGQAPEWTGDDRGNSAATLDHCARVEDLSAEAKGLLSLTNGAQTFTAALYPVLGQAVPMLIFEGDCPERDQDFWISDIRESSVHAGGLSSAAGTVVAFPTRHAEGASGSEQKVAATSRFAAE